MMPGMGSGLRSSNSLIVDSFHRALWLQFLVVLVIVAAVAILRSVSRARQFRLASIPSSEPGSNRASSSSSAAAEPVARRCLRIGFGLLWVLDGILQGQSAMPLSMPSQVLQPAASSSPGWVQHLVNFGGTMWIDHPVTAAAAAVWIQVGIGLMLLAAPSGRWSRFAGVSTAAWGLVVWVFGEAFGGIFAPGLTWLFGAPGAVLLYSFAGILLTLPERVWYSPNLGRMILRATGLFFVGMAILQAWPGRGFWQGQIGPGRVAGALSSMVDSMSQTPQPNLFASIVHSFGQFDTAHGWGVNLFCIIALALIGGGFLSARPTVAFWSVIAGLVLCLADWILIEDFGFFGGVGTDPNSMIPMALIFVAGYLGMTRVPAPVPAMDRLPRRLDLRSWLSLDPAQMLRTGAAVGAFLVVLLGAVPMVAAAASPRADPILQEAMNGDPQAEHERVPNFTLIDQSGRTRTLSSFHGRTLVITFLDPVCTSDCPVIAQELRAADLRLGAEERHVAMAAIVTNPIYHSLAFTRAFDRQEYLSGLPNWYFLTGTRAELAKTLVGFGGEAIVEPGGAMVDHSFVALVIDKDGYLRTIVNNNPGPATGALQSSFASLLDSEIQQAMLPWVRS